MQVGQLAEHLAVLGVQAFDETGVVQPGLAVRFVQIAKLVQALHDRLAARRRKLLPTWKQRLPNFPLLVGSHLLPDSLAFAEFLLLRRSQLIPGLQALADSRLLVRRQISEALVVLKEFFLPVWRHVPEALKRVWRQIVQVPGVGTRKHGIRTIQLPASFPALCAAFLRCRLADPLEHLPEDGRTE